MTEAKPDPKPRSLTSGYSHGRVEGWCGNLAAPSPAPARSNAACGFPALRFPVRFTPRFMDRQPAFFSEHILRLSSCRLMDVIIRRPCLALLPKELRTAGPLGSTDVTPLPGYYGPIRRPLAFGRFPGLAGYAAYLPPPIPQRGEEGLSSCSTRPCHRAAATTPPE